MKFCAEKGNIEKLFKESTMEVLHFSPPGDY
jgi:hypothetical protein